jgi:signal transduction histidine kinase/ActR/RegA family two-component response regulator
MTSADTNGHRSNVKRPASAEKGAHTVPRQVRVMNHFLMEASIALGSSLDFEATLRQVLRLVVPALSDWCIVDIHDSDGTIRRATGLHSDPTKQTLLEEYSHRYPPRADARHGAPLVIRTGHALLVPAVNCADLSHVTADGDRRRMLEELGVRSLMLVPLSLQGRVLGVISLVVGHSGRRFGEGDLVVAEDLARRVALALENARLYSAERRARAEAESAAEQLRLAHERLVRGERMQALGTMASGVAHDFNNLLGVILGRCELLLNGRTSKDAAPAHVSVIRQAALDGAETIRRLQAFTGARRGPAEDSIDLDRLVRDVVDLTRPRWKDTAHARGLTFTIQTSVVPLPRLRGSAADLRDVVLNLMMNALDAMPEGGTIRISARSLRGQVLLSVADTGRGMTDAVRQHIFEPFFSTKGTRGAGLGLSMSYGIVAGMGGRIDVVSTPGNGAIFTIVLPLHPDDQDTLTCAGTRPYSLLVVDDEPAMLETASLLLETAGHRVTTACGGAEALKLLDRGRHIARFDVVLTDVSMPQMSGLQLVKRIRARGHTLPCVLVTGWGTDIPAEAVASAGAQYMLPKPFSLAQVERVLEEVLA